MRERDESGKADRQCSNPERARLEGEKRESQYVDTREAELDISPTEGTTKVEEVTPATFLYYPHISFAK